MKQRHIKKMAVLVMVLFAAAMWLAAAPAQAAITGPTGITVTAAPGTATVTWTNTATGSILSTSVQRADFAKGKTSYSVAGAATTLTQTGLISGSTYYYRLRTNTSTGSSSWSAVKSVTIP